LANADLGGELTSKNPTHPKMSNATFPQKSRMPSHSTTIHVKSLRGF